MIRFAAYFWLVGMSLIFASTPGNPFGVEGLSEAYLGLAIAYAGFAAVKGRIGRGELLFIALPLGGMLLSAAIAKGVYGQPLYLGLIEERRMLMLLFYFPLRDLTYRVGYDGMRRMILNTALFCATLGFLWYVDLVGGWVELSRRFEMADRANFGSVFVAIALLLNFRREPWWKIAYLFGFLVLVSQTRQVLIAVIIALVALYVIESLKNRRPFLLAALLFALILVLVPAAIDPYAVISLLPSSFQELAQAQYLEGSARSRAYADVFNHFRPFGHGALSGNFKGGFSLHFGPYFFLADIGIVGTIHRFGWLALLYCIVTLLLIVSIWRRASMGEGWQFVAIFASTISLLATWPTAGLLEYRGSYVAMLAALAMVCSQGRLAYVTRAPATQPSIRNPRLSARW